jgi:hypothetical protein
MSEPVKPTENAIPATPQKEKTSFVNPDDVNKTDAQKQAEKKEIVPPEVTLMLMYGKLDAILTEMKTLVSIFSKAKNEGSATATAVPPAKLVTPQENITKPTETNPRIMEIIAALDPVKDLIKIDTDSSTLLVIVRPAQYLGSENFSKLASIVRTIGGQYVSAGKNSHFEVPKATSKK